MKKFIPAVLIAAIVFMACKKTGSPVTDTSITASTTTATVGQAVTFNVSTSSNAVSWTVTPATYAVKQYDISVQKTNVISFTQAGTYTIGVRTRNIAYDSAHHQNLDSCWHHGGGDGGHCTKGLDSASVTVKVSL